jgi:crotonobetainyl-CoA:carnitine CoA-transferase CaiB-like acyl-CoA transferase
LSLSEKLQPMLSGVRVVDLAHMLAGGYGSMLLGDLGAEVIKIEPLEIGDRTRLLGPPFVAGESGYFLAINRNKKSVALDLKKGEGRRVLYDLVRVSDVVFDNFRPGVMEEMGCGYETLKEINPGIVYCTLSGFGETGPYRDRPAFDLAIQAISGAMSITGEPGRPPVRMGVPMGDLGGSLFCALAISAALYAREKTGLGRKMDIALMDCLVSLLTYVGQYYLLDGQVPGPMGSGHVSVVPYQAFPTRDIYIVVAVFVEKFWQALCRVLGLEGLVDDPRFADNDGRRDHREELIPILEDVFRTRSGEEWLRLLAEAGVPCGPISTLNRVFADPQVAARNMVVEMDHPKVGRYRSIGNPVKTPALPEGPFEPPPMHGQHTEDVLGEVLGYSPERIEELKGKGVIK